MSQDALWGEPLERLVSRYGAVNTLRRQPAQRGLAELAMFSADLGSAVPGRLPDGRRHAAGGRSLAGPGLARALALAEAAERSSAAEPPGTAYRWATQAELEGRALDHRAFPRCSADEYAQPGCPVAPFDEHARIRWVRGRDLATGEELWVPACMTTYRLPDREPGERFWYPISTGHAVHTDPAAATFGGLAEVVERDAIAVLWLQRLSLPFLPASAVDAHTGRLLDWCGDHFIEAHLFDATTDLGLPIVYSLLRSPHDPVLHTLVGAGTGLTYAEAALKALLEAIGLRTSLSTKAEPPASYADFHSVLDGTRYMGARERADAFDFLLTPDELRPASTERGAYAADPQQATDRLVGAVNAAGMEAVVVDRTNDELAELGLTAVCVIVPGLQPMSLQPLAQFREHPRLHTAPGRMGYRALAPEQLNPLPQPFG